MELRRGRQDGWTHGQHRDRGHGCPMMLLKEAELD